MKRDPGGEHGRDVPSYLQDYEHYQASHHPQSGVEHLHGAGSSYEGQPCPTTTHAKIEQIRHMVMQLLSRQDALERQQGSYKSYTSSDCGDDSED